jgi:hypothetical protein
LKLNKTAGAPTLLPRRQELIWSAGSSRHIGFGWRALAVILLAKNPIPSRHPPFPSLAYTLLLCTSRSHLHHVLDLDKL